MRRRSDSLKANLCQAQQRDLKTIAPLLHRPIVLTDTIDYRTIVFCTIVLTLHHTDLLEILLFEEADGLVNVETVCELHVLRALHLLNAPVVAGSV